MSLALEVSEQALNVMWQYESIKSQLSEWLKWFWGHGSLTHHIGTEIVATVGAST